LEVEVDVVVAVRVVGVVAVGQLGPVGAIGAPGPVPAPQALQGALEQVVPGTAVAGARVGVEVGAVPGGLQGAEFLYLLLRSGTSQRVGRR